MKTPFNVNEVFEIAEQIERNGYNFYAKAAKNAANRQAGKFLKGLAEMEVGHIDVFANMRDKFAGADQPDIFDLDGQAAKYLHAMVEGCVFTGHDDPAASLKGDETIVQILEKAIGLEKSAIAFYYGVLSVVTCPETKTGLQSIIEEEMSHVVMLKEKLDSLASEEG